ncbi:MAG: IPT/TIG domain-containing protein, partial [Actinomycetia bacterium]|nr:IPT/TIG domain-containing protein [Actinomycetes bacterium]
MQVSVTTATGTSANTPADDFRYTAVGKPTVTDLTPNAGPAAAGTTVAITGTNFTSDATVKFGTKAATDVVVNSLTKITYKAPAGTAGSVVDVLVTTTAGTSDNTAADNYTYGAPTVTAVSPTHGPAAGGTTVVITGTSFTADAKVYFGSTVVASSDVTVNSSTKITVVSPAGTAGETVQVKVTTDAGSSPDTAADDFTYDAKTPVIDSISPSAGDPDGGETVTIKGSGFGNDEDEVRVLFGSVEAEVEDVNSTGTQLKVEAPAGTDGTVVDVRVITDMGTSPNTQADDYA